MKLYIPSRHNSVLEELDKHFDVVPTIKDSDVVILWNDVNPFERGIISLARTYKKKVVVLQHGRKGSSKYFPPFNERIQADALLVWGEFDKRSLVATGQDPQKIRVVGTTVLQNLPERKEHEGINIVFCPEHWDKEVEENSKVKKELRKLRYKDKTLRIVTKLIEGHDYQNYDNPIQTNRNSKEHLQICKELLSTADLVVGVSESTFELLAQSMDIPVVIMDEWLPKPCNGDERYKTYRRVVSEGSARTGVKDLNATILRELGAPSRLRDKRREVAVDEGGLGLDTIALIKECLKKI
jgi:hypothetical protein